MLNAQIISTRETPRFHLGEEVILTETGAVWTVSSFWRWEEEWYYDLYQPGHLKCGVIGCKLMTAYPPKSTSTVVQG